MKGVVWGSAIGKVWYGGQQYERCGMGFSNMKSEVWGSAI